MTWAREYLATTGLKMALEQTFSMPVQLIDPDGNDITTNVDGDTLRGQVLYDTDDFDPESGDPIVINETRVTLRKSGLSRVPQSGETWVVKIPLNPDNQSALTQFLTNGDEAIVDGDSLGFVTLLLKKADQS